MIGGLVGGCVDAGAPECATVSAGKALPYCLLEALVVRVRGASSLEVGQVVLLNVDDTSAVILGRDEAGFYARSAICTHACCVVALCADDGCGALSPTPGACEQTPRGVGMALCPCHGSVFRLSDGVPINGPAMTPLPAYAVRLAGADVLIDTGELTSVEERA